MEERSIPTGFVRNYEAAIRILGDKYFISPAEVMAAPINVVYSDAHLGLLRSHFPQTPMLRYMQKNKKLLCPNTTKGEGFVGGLPWVMVNPDCFSDDAVGRWAARLYRELRSDELTPHPTGIAG